MAVVVTNVTILARPRPREGPGLDGADELSPYIELYCLLIFIDVIGLWMATHAGGGAIFNL